jgi:hypothetical protein
MSAANKTRFIIAVRRYKIISSARNANFTDISVLDPSNKKILLRTIDPSSNRYVDLSDITSLTDKVKAEAYDSAILISSNFTLSATTEMMKQNIQCVSESYMPPFALEDLYLAIISCVSNKCNKKCGKIPEEIPECNEIKDADMCKIRGIAADAKAHFEAGAIGLLKNDLKVALALGQ